METRDREPKKILISLRRLNELAKSLPDPETSSERSVEMRVGAALVKFERIKYVTSSGEVESRWSYHSRIVI